MMKRDTTHQEVINMMMWSLLAEMDFKKILYSNNVDEVYNKEYEFLKNKVDSKELTREDLQEIRDNISAHAKVLFNRIGEDWGRGDDGCMDIAEAAVAFGKENYKKCLADHNYLVSMREATREYENVLYAFNHVIDPNL